MAEKNGVTIIPASQRPDGTWRKEIRVKAGYVPPDEAERYQSRGKQWSSKASDLPPGMSSTTQGDQPEETKKSKNQKKNERKKQKKLEESSLKNTKSSAVVNNLLSEVEKLQIDKSQTEKQPEPAAAPVSKDALEKKIKGLKKKLRQIEDLESKLSSGQIKELTKEQKDKVSRKKDLLDELEELELDFKLCD